ncbi:hypothetical protein A3F58_04150 [Candidatus Roizmanbacteria bacterium RIFCSPHIGHO2_12_FULL_37_9b]|uniref:Glycosyl transferase family 1 domain-containing protein n=1 Tax=Candidatus Roizmanbacteria bacterium RIFCSPHIGHO2_02_FULL_38_11 TaxID=1802039 RepID=A0A1F7H1C0_9BACT|nr:MAG: hypothetical protein A3C25_02385 [Candidatus Roizmanbacteria bacterium RIFCSPHIGHO2_02_FULL_38_11]OGK34722.1 MAG: hypothetical protein A3F58_04150 [Candidatus Roizmanbacteria bacterium RIFCSPHIGHO2_12_FULL_37_9b]
MKVAVAHFRIGLTDGVSLQIEERVRILNDLGHDIVFIAGTSSPIADLRIPYFEYKTLNEIVSLQDQIFQNGIFPVGSLVEQIADEIGKKLDDFWQKEKFSHIFIHNIFSLPVCLPATLAFYNFLKNHPDLVGVAVHHDFWWDPARIKKFEVRSSKLEKFLENYFPPELPNLTHTTISTWERQELKKRRGINSEVITDTYDFEQKAWIKNESNKNFLKDVGLTGKELILLLASRVRPRKGIEIGIEFTSLLKQTRKVVLLLPNDYSDMEKEYVEKLKRLAADLNVDVCWIQNWVGSEEEKKNGLKKYSLWDTYVFSDIVLYPSLWEGFGNQFLEAVFAKKPIVVYEYEVFKTDIKKAGFQVISLGDKYLIGENGLAKISLAKYSAATRQTQVLLSDKEKYNRMIEDNFAIGKRRFDTKSVLKKHLEKLLQT